MSTEKFEKNNIAKLPNEIILKIFVSSFSQNIAQVSLVKRVCKNWNNLGEAAWKRVTHLINKAIEPEPLKRNEKIAGLCKSFSEKVVEKAPSKTRKTISTTKRITKEQEKRASNN